MTALLRLVEYVQPADLTQVLARTHQVFEPVLTSTGITPPTFLIDAVVELDGPSLDALANHATGTKSNRAGVLAASGHPTVAKWVAEQANWGLVDTRTLLAAADPADERWTAPQGPVHKLLEVTPDSSYRRHRLLRAAVVCPFPQVIQHALDGGLPTGLLTRAERLRALLSLHTHGGPAALAQALESRSLREQPEDVAEYAEAALRDEAGLAALRAEVTTAEGTTGAIQELHQPGRYPTLKLRKTLDWTAIQAAHQDQAFKPDAIHALARRQDCPDEVMAALVAAHPEPLDFLQRLERPIPLAAFAAVPAARVSKDLGTLAVKSSLRGIDLLTIRCGAKILELAQDSDKRDWTEFREALAKLVAEKLGDDPIAWRIFREKLDRTRSSVVDLLNTVNRLAAKEKAKGPDGTKPWPGETGTPNFNPYSGPYGLRAAFVTVLDTTPCAVHWNLLDHMDGQTVHDLLVGGTWRDEWLELAMAPKRRRERIMLSRRQDLPADAVTRLAELDDPEINIGLVYQRNCPWDLRLALVTGTPLTPGHTDRLSTTDLAHHTLDSADSSWLIPWAASGDIRLTVKVTRQDLSSRHLQLRLLLGRWLRHGREGLKQGLPNNLTPKLSTLVEELLANPDPDAALAQLRQMAKEAGSTQQLATRIRRYGEISRLALEGYVWDWDVLLAEHRRKPLPLDKWKMWRLDGYPAAILEPSRQASDSERRAWRDLIDGQPAAKVLPRILLTDQGTAGSWVNQAIAEGHLTPSEVLTLAKPARLALHLALSKPTTEQARQDLAALVNKHLDGRPDAWVLALRMLETFPGTVPELLETASAAA